MKSPRPTLCSLFCSPQLFYSPLDSQKCHSLRSPATPRCHRAPRIAPIPSISPLSLLLTLSPKCIPDRLLCAWSSCAQKPLPPSRATAGAFVPSESACLLSAEFLLHPLCSGSAHDSLSFSVRSCSLTSNPKSVCGVSQPLESLVIVWDPHLLDERAMERS